MLKKPRPEIYKGKIIEIGTFGDDGRPTNWIISGKDESGNIHPRSVAYYACDGWEIYCGYTIEELREIAAEK